MASLRIDSISLSEFKSALARYTDVAPSTLADLDTLRYETVPAKLRDMKGEKHLLKADVEKLVEWKLKHGTFRPSLMNLVRSNPADVVKSTTQSAFSSLDSEKDVIKALKILTQLRGIGPATASLLLSVYQPDTVPFFSDELFRWTHWGDSGAGEGWERKIKYNLNEYKEILATVEELRARLGVDATEAEKVAYVLGKEGLDLNRGVGEDASAALNQKVDLEGEEAAEKQTAKTKARAKEEEDLKVRDSKDTRKASTSHVSNDTEKKGTKRKAQEQKAPAEGTRRSTRRKN
ncbi:hypothetical protein OPT61_g404 [Boeremia exigua]|uniref:Uncharacterized protein n=1 Tax=Boeremia exigua TaxID=749465 RepID=A0ACC2IU39_9PLEO|nr:hypothetical protein OPT61_g404 [Boeremia exigua]